MYMAGKHITPTQKTKALTLRSGGLTITVISDKTGISISSLKRLFNEHSVKKGELKQSVISKATDELIHDASTIEIIRREAASLVLDDLAMVKRLRIAMAEAIDALDATNTAEALQVMRAVSAGAVALKSTSETPRKSLGLDKENEFSEDLPELTIKIMTNEEIDIVKQRARERSLGLDDGLGGVADDDDNDVIIEGVDEPEEVLA